jgi:toxin FitB
MIVLDTNVISELMKINPNQRVFTWFRQVRRADLVTTAISRAEIMMGIRLLDAGRRRVRLMSQADLVFRVDLEGRVIPFDSAAADEYAVIVPHRQRIGRRIELLDALIAAIARARGAALATRNVADFADCGIDLIDPWQA